MSARQVALDLLIRVDREKSYPNILLAERLSVLPEARDRSFCTELVCGVTERKITLDYHIANCLSMPFRKLHIVTRNILRLGTYQILFMNVPASAACNTSVDLAKKNGQARSAGLVNAILRKLAVTRETLTVFDEDPVRYLSILYSVDPSIISLLIKQYGQEFTEAYFTALQNKPKDRSVIAVNVLLTTGEELRGRLADEGVSAEMIHDDLMEIRFTGRIEDLSSYREGLFHFIGRESYEAIGMLDVTPGQNVMDCCSAPGGKTFLMAYRMKNKGEILAVDIHKNKIRRMEEQAARLKIQNIRFLTADASHFMPELEDRFDRVLCDVPCSGLGMIAKKPDIRYKSMEDLSLIDVQRDILKNALRYVKPEGAVLYSTCTVNDEENGQAVRSVCGEYKINDRLFLPQTDGTDGFYAARIEKK